MISPLTDKIAHFWKWFVQMEGPIRSFFTEEEPVNRDLIVESMNNRVLDFGIFTWEIGPGKDRPYYFLISPNGDKERLELSRKIIHQAPDLPNWEFLSARPIQEVELSFSIYDNMFRKCEVNAQQWEFALGGDRRKGVEVVIKALDIEHLDEDTQFEAADRVVMGLIGEAVFIDQIADLVIVNDFSSQEASKSYPIQQLAFRLQELP
ncbi:MAG: hypothetical protein AAGA10_21855 [Bacteroidota bacterium]